MTIEVISPPPPVGWDYYCGGCDEFFSVDSDKATAIKYCPVCGWDTLVKCPEEFEKAYPHYQYRSAS